MAFTRRIEEIQSYLKQYVKGQDEAIKLVSILLTNRERIEKIKQENIEVEYPKEELTLPNIMLVGPSGCGKTEIAKRIAEICGRFWFRIPCTVFSATGYIGKNTEDILDFAIETALHQLIEERRKQIMNEKVLAKLLRKALLSGPTLSLALESKIRKWVELYLTNPNANELKEMVSATLPYVYMEQGRPYITTGTFYGTVKEAIDMLIDGTVFKDYDELKKEAIRRVENGIIMLDEIDKIVGGKTDNVSTYGVQRELLAIVEGSTFYTKHGTINTKNVLFIAAGAFQAVSIDEMLPELRGRFPVLIKLNKLTKKEFIDILKHSKLSPLKRLQAILKADGITIEFTDEAIDYLAEIAEKMNEKEQIGARRLWELFDKHLIDLYLIEKDMVVTKEMLQVILEKKVETNKQMFIRPIPHEMYV